MTGGVALFILIPELLCLMGILLWATPGGPRRGGRQDLGLSGRAAGRQGSDPAGEIPGRGRVDRPLALASLTLSVAIVRPVEGTLLTWFAVARLVVLACLAYGAIFVLLGVLFLRRGMLAAVAYTVVFEVAVALIPAVINQFTVQYHLRCLLIRWMDWPAVPREFPGACSATARGGSTC